MTTGRNRVYADTSVYGGIFDPEFERGSKAFFAQVVAGRFQLLVSPIVRDELALAPAHVRSIVDSLGRHAEMLSISEEALSLRRAYLDAGIVGSRWQADALHVALATAAGCWAIVSWNFRHIVHFDKIALYNAINVAYGFGSIGIHTPNEVISYEDD